MDFDLLDFPLGFKIHVKPRSKPVFCRGQLGEKLQGPCLYYSLDDPYSHHLSIEYNCLHDPHLREYHHRKDVLKLLRRRGLVTRDNKVICTLKEFNQYRDYVTRLKLQAEEMLGRRDVFSWAEEQLTAAEAQKLQYLAHIVVHKVFGKLKVPQDQHITFLRRAARGIRGQPAHRCRRPGPLEKPLDRHQKIEVMAQELVAMVLDNLGDHLESRTAQAGAAARPVDGGTTRAERLKEALDRERLHTCLDKLTQEVVKSARFFLKSYIARWLGQGYGYTEILELHKEKVSKRKLQSGEPAASEQQRLEASKGAKLHPLEPQDQAEGTGYDKTLEADILATVEENLEREINATGLANNLDIRTMANRIVQSLLERLGQPGTAPKPEGNFQGSATKPPTPQGGKEGGAAEDTLPSLDPECPLQPVPPVGPKPPAQAGARRRSGHSQPV
ncbi:uncharacterized protein LOC114070958 isoform X4 [Empidonax traillii]|uniref:uncharacterized protein LOC114070958 isoform X2 n=1 Tax=Empidonax traillii TaxID=164674 RepID=UPI000FFDAD3A|nr:uncharacterized protein LOC114070958 isoform X2 [Empidonax traillii]XP_027764393.1 uncharacterized protein LOC114070958 isoform X4 [Empidonax traillii]